jgi:hypothetical protein
MISPAHVDEIRRLLNGGKLSQRTIARQTGVSRGTVQAIADGRHPSGSARRAGRRRDGFSPPIGLPARCPGCGAKVRMPCLACYIKKTKSRQKNTADSRGPERGAKKGLKTLVDVTPLRQQRLQVDGLWVGVVGIPRIGQQVVN